MNSPSKLMAEQFYHQNISFVKPQGSPSTKRPSKLISPSKVVHQTVFPAVSPK